MVQAMVSRSFFYLDSNSASNFCEHLKHEHCGKIDNRCQQQPAGGRIRSNNGESRGEIKETQTEQRRSTRDCRTGVPQDERRNCDKHQRHAWEHALPSQEKSFFSSVWKALIYCPRAVVAVH